jgi:hypothetical protein
MAAFRWLFAKAIIKMVGCGVAWTANADSWQRCVSGDGAADFAALVGTQAKTISPNQLVPLHHPDVARRYSLQDQN